MYVEILFCLPAALLLSGLLFISGHIFNKLVPVYNEGTDQPLLNFIGKSMLGFMVIAIIYALATTYGKTVQLGLLLLIFVFAAFYKNVTNKIKLPGMFSFKAFSLPILVLAALLTGIYLFMLLQNYHAFKTGYPIVFFDYHFYAMIAKGLGAVRTEGVQSMYKGYGIQCGTLLYHYTDLWLTGLISKITGLNPLLVLLFIIYPVLLTLFAAGIIGLSKLLIPGVKSWQVLALVIATGGINVYLSFYSQTNLLNNFGLKCFAGLNHSHKLLIIFVLALCALVQFLQNDFTKAVLWLSFLCIIYPTVIPAIGGGLTLSLGILLAGKKTDLKNASSLMLLLLLSIGYILIFDHLFSDKPRQALKLDFLHQIKLIAVLQASYLLKLMIVFFPAWVLLALRFFYETGFNRWEKIVWLFTACSLFTCTLFAAENHGTIDISQAIYNIAPPLIIISATLSALLFFASSAPALAKGIYILMLCAFSCYNLVSDYKDTSAYLNTKNEYSDKYMSACVKGVNKCDGNKRFANIALVDSCNLSSWFYNFRQPASFLDYSDKVLTALDISPFLLTGKDYSAYFNSPDDYNNPIEAWFRKNKIQNMKFDGPLLLKYFSDCHMDYVDVVSGYKFPDGVNSHLQLISKDANTGEEFYKINL